MQYGMFSWFGYCLPLARRLQIIRRAGFTAATLWWEDEIGDAPVSCKAMPRLVADQGLYLENIHLPFSSVNDLWGDSNRARQEMVDQMLRWVDDCAAFQIPMMVMHLSEGPSPLAVTQPGLTALETVVEAAQRVGVTTAVENTRWPRMLTDVFSAVDSPRLGFCYDSSHAHLGSSRDGGLLERWGHRLVALHLSDNDGLEDRHWLPGDGTINWSSLISRFPESYTGVLTLEVCASLEEQRKLHPQEYVRRAFQQVCWLKGLCDSRADL